MRCGGVSVRYRACVRSWPCVKVCVCLFGVLLARTCTCVWLCAYVYMRACVCRGAFYWHHYCLLLRSLCIDRWRYSCLVFGLSPHGSSTAHLKTFLPYTMSTCTLGVCECVLSCLCIVSLFVFVRVESSISAVTQQYGLQSRSNERIESHWNAQTDQLNVVGMWSAQ